MSKDDLTTTDPIKDAEYDQSVYDAAIKEKLEHAPKYEAPVAPTGAGKIVPRAAPFREHGVTREEEALSGNIAVPAPVLVEPQVEPKVEPKPVAAAKPKAKAKPKPVVKKPVVKPEPVVKPGVYPWTPKGETK